MWTTLIVRHQYGAHMSVADWLGVGTLTVAAVGLCFVVFQLSEQRRAMRAQFGNLYIERFWQIDDALLLETKGTELHRRHRHRYLRLFEDEFDVARLGFLDERQWAVWHSVLDEPEALSLVKKDLELCAPDEEKFQRLRACIVQRDDVGKRHDIANCEGTRNN